MAGRADVPAEALLSRVETFRDYVLANDYVLGDHRVALTLASLVKSNHRGLHVLAYDEIPAEKQIRVVGTVGSAQAA